MSFRLVSAYFKGRDLPLISDRPRSNKNTYTVVIGKNGVGKSRLLAAIARSFHAVDRFNMGLAPLLVRGPDASFALRYRLGNETFELVLQRGRLVSGPIEREHLPMRVICTSASPFDKFPVDREPSFSHINNQRMNEEEYDSFISSKGTQHVASEYENRLYRYLGAKNRSGNYSSQLQLNRFIESLFFASRRTQRERAGVIEVFKFLKYVPKIKVRYRLSKAIFERLRDTKGKKDFQNYLRNYAKRYLQNPRRTLLQARSYYLESIEYALRAIASEVHFRNIMELELDFRQLYKDSRFSIFEHLTLLTSFGFAKLAEATLYKVNVAEPVRLREMSSGEQCVFVTLLGIGSEIIDNCLVCIDEPEISLHPEWQEQFIELLRTTFKNYKGVHFLLATHSPQVLSRLGTDADVLLMDNGKILPATTYADRSADFQLAEAFHAPGFKNEYLAREALTLLAYLNESKKLDPAQLRRYEELITNMQFLDSNDPVKELIAGVIEAKSIRDDQNAD